MKLLVVGAQGQLARSLKELGAHPELDIITRGRPQLDLLNPQSIKSAVTSVRPLIVINTAAYTACDKAEDEVDLAYALNRDGARHVAEVCATTNTPLIHISTDYVFDGSERRPKTETDNTRPLNIYGLSKLDGEHLVAATCHRHVILRTAWIFSPFGSNFVKTVLKLAKSQPELTVVDDQIGNPTYAHHLAIGIVKIARLIAERAEEFPWGIFHLTGSGEATRYELAREVLKRSTMAGGPFVRLVAVNTAQYPRRAARPADSRLDSSKSHIAFGMHLPDWRSGVADCVDLLLREASVSLTREE